MTPPTDAPGPNPDADARDLIADSEPAVAVRPRRGRWALGVGLAALVVLSPTWEGWALLEARSAVESELRAPGMMHPEAKVVIQPIRWSLGSIAGQELATWAIEQRRGEMPEVFLHALAQGHGEEAAHAIAPGYFNSDNTCVIRVSAQGPGREHSATRGLATLLDDSHQFWRYVLLHEVAHCEWDVETLLAQSAAAGRSDAATQRLLSRLAQFLNESYADNRAALALLRADGPAGRDTVAKVLQWRMATTRPGSPHRTVLALIELDDAMAGSYRSNDWDRNHQLARDAAWLAADGWLEEQGIAPATAARTKALLRNAVPEAFVPHPAPPRFAS